MANPQVEDGHVRIANEIADQLSKINLSAYEWRVLWAIWRKTYGWHKIADRISYTQFEQMTGLNRRHIARTISQLKNRNIVTISGNKHSLNYSFQKDYAKWTSLPKGVTTHTALPIGVTNVTNRGNKNVTNRGNETLPKGVTGENEKSESQTLPKGVIGITNRGNENVTNRGKHKNNKTLIQKQEKREEKLLSEKERYLFRILKQCPAIKKSDAYKLPELMEDYPNLNYKLEFKKFVEWWPEKKHKRPWATLRNWLERAQPDETKLVDSGRYQKYGI